jgi:tetratricopeptide (TPR) repeat protein
MPDKTNRRGRLDALTAARVRSLGLATVFLLLSGCGLFITPRHRIDVAQKDIAAGRWQEAASELRTVIQADDRNSAAWQLLAEVSLDTGDLKGAQAMLQHALGAGARGPGTDALRLRVWLAAGEPQAVLDAIAHHTVDPGEPTRSLEQAKAYIALGHADEAIQTLQPLLAQHPELTQARVAMAQALAGQGKLDAALQQLADAMQHDTRSPLAPLLQGRILAGRGQYAAAESSLRLAITRMPRAQPLPDRVGALILLTETQLAGGNPGAAAASQAALANLIPNSPMSDLLRARIELARGRTRKGIDALLGVLAKAPGFVAARMYLGAAELAQGNLEQAQDQLEEVVRQQPNDIAARKLLATVCLRLGDPEGALSVLTPALAWQMGDSQLLTLVAAAQRRAGGADTSLQALEQESRSNPKNQALAFNLARLQAGRGDLAGAKATLEGALKANPTANVLLLALARVELAQGDLKTARESLNELLARINTLLASQPGDAGALALKGYVESALGDSEAALAAYTQAQAVHPTAQVAVDLYRLRLASHDAQPEKPLEDWLARSPRDWGVHETLGDYYLAIRDWQPAARELEATLQEAPDNAVALNNLAWAYEQLNDPRAEPLAERAYRLAPKSAQVADTLGWILVQRHEAARAVQVLAHAVELTPGDSEVEYHYAYALLGDGRRDEATRILTKLTSSSQPFDSRADAQRLLAAMKPT